MLVVFIDAPTPGGAASAPFYTPAPVTPLPATRASGTAGVLGCRPFASAGAGRSLDAAEQTDPRARPRSARVRPGRAGGRDRTAGRRVAGSSACCSARVHPVIAHV